MQQQERGLSGVSVNEVFIGNGVSELIDLSLRALLSPGDEVLVPSPDYPLWSAAVSLNGGKAVHYPCPPERLFQPDLDAIEALRLCSNVPGQWAVQTALGGFQSIQDLVKPGGRLYQSRQAVIECVEESQFLSMTRPMGAMYAFIRLPESLPQHIGDKEFALQLLEDKHVLVAPGSSFNTPYSNYFRITTLPDPDVLHDVFQRIDALLEQII